MKARNLYKRSSRSYEGENNIVLTNAMKAQGFRVNVWVTDNQLLGKGKGYDYGKLSLVKGADPIVIDKWDYRKEAYHKVTLYNIDQTNFPSLYPNDYQHMKDQDADMYFQFVAEKVQSKRRSIIRRVTAMF